MLVLSRKPGQSIRIGDTVVTVLRAGSSVKLGIVAPRGVRVVRVEIEKRAA